MTNKVQGKWSTSPNFGLHNIWGYFCTQGPCKVHTFARITYLTVRCLRRKLVHRWRSVMMFGRIYYSLWSGVMSHPKYFTSSSAMFVWLISTGSSSTGVDAACWRIRLNLTWLAAAKCHRCSRRIFGSIAAAMCLRFFGEVQVICRSWWIRWGVEGVRRVVRRGPKRPVLYAESEELH